MGLSTNILWHQTHFDGLKAILREKCFKSSYSLETINWRYSEYKCAFPMISFCDIPFADMYDYLTNANGSLTGKYGKYTIGMKRAWGLQKGLTPVWYRDKLSSSLLYQKQILSTLESNNIKTELDCAIYKLSWYVLANTKNYEGKLKKYGFNSYRFYNEREFRYVPDYDLIQRYNYSPLMLEDEYRTYKKQHNGQSLINDIRINFSIEDIAYILISNKNQIGRVKKLLMGENHSIGIFSYDQIVQNIIGINHNRKT